MLVELEVPTLGAGQVLVEIEYSGVCHTQLLECRGYRGEDKYLPHCLGHEGSGAILEVGPGVTKVKPGERVVISWIQGSGPSVRPPLYQWNSRTVNSGPTSTFGRHTVVLENRVTVVPDWVDARQAALLGCAAATGLGAVFNTARPTPGQSLAVFGVGGIGLSAVAAARIAGCSPVIAIDVLDERLAVAACMGADHRLNPSFVDVDKMIAKLCPGGLDFAIEASGRPAVMAQALKNVRSRGGATVIIGNAHHGEQLTLDPQQFNQGKRLLGTWGGDTYPDTDFPRYCELLRDGRLNLEPLLSRTYSLEEINEALDDLEAGRVTRPMVAMRASQTGA